MARRSLGVQSATQEAEILNLVERFNSKIRSISGSLAAYQPREISGADFVDSLRTYDQREIKRETDRLRRYLKDGAESTIKLKSGDRITKWERNEVNNMIASINRRAQNLAKANPPSRERGTYTRADVERGNVLRRSRVNEYSGEKLREYISNVREEATISAEQRRQHYVAQYGQVLETSHVITWISDSEYIFIQSLPSAVVSDMYYYAEELRPKWLYEAPESQGYDYAQAYLKALSDYMKEKGNRELKERFELMVGWR